jgi:hypothetical protein
MVEIDKSIDRPQLGMQFLTCNYVASALDKEGKHLERLTRKAQVHPIFAQVL